MIAVLLALGSTVGAGARVAALNNVCTHASTPDDSNYDPGEGPSPTTTWNEEQWYLYSCMPQSAPLAQDPENASGMSVDRAWQAYGRGSDQVLVAYMEGGVNWRITDSQELRLRAWLNRGELPYPEFADGTTRADRGMAGDPYDLNGDGVFNVDDYAQDPRVPQPYLHPQAGGITTEDLIAAFGHCRVNADHTLGACPAGGHVDNDGNGYANDISGWNFHRDTNDPQVDQSTYHHSDDESSQVVAQADDGSQGLGVAGMCPNCRLLTVKAGDEAIDRPDRVAEAITFAVDSGARVITGVIASIGLTPEVRAALQYAYDHNVVVAWASNDFESADHTDGMFYPRVWPGNSIVGDQSSRSGTSSAPGSSPTFALNHTYRSRSSLTSYGPHSLFSVPNNDGSTSTGTPTAAGVAALVVSEGLQAAAAGSISSPLTADEVEQVVRSTVSAIDDPTVNLSFPGLPGASFNDYYGYGRPNVLRADQAVAAGLIPPTVDITAPDWYREVDPTRQPTLRISADVSAQRADGRALTYDIQYALGSQPLDSQFTSIATGSATGAATVGADLDLSRIPPSFWAGQYTTSTTDRIGSIERYDVTVRVQVHDSTHGVPLTGEDRRAFHLRHDDTERAGFPVRIGTSGESSPTMADIEGLGVLDTVVATADGTVHALRPDGAEAPGFPVHTGPAPGMDPASDVNYLQAPAWRDGRQPRPRDGISSPTAIGDIHHDGSLDIVASTMSGRTYAWDGTGALLPGFPVQTDRNVAHQAVPVPDTPYTRNASTGSLAAPVLADLEGSGLLDIIQAAWDGHVYAWRPDGTAVPGWPVATENPNKPSGSGCVYARDFKVASTPAVADVDGDGTPDVLVPLQDTSWCSSQGAPITAYLAAFHGQGTNHPGGALIPGWPVPLQGAAQGYGSAQDFITEGVTSPVVMNLGGHLTAVDSPELFFPYTIDLATRGVLPIVPAVSALGVPAEFTTSPSAGRLLGGPSPQVAQSGSNAADILIGVVTAPGQGDRVQSLLGAWDPATHATLPQLDQPIQGLGFITAPAIADVTGSGRQDVIQATDSGALMAFDGHTGQVASGFPKWTGGWSLYTPAVGDVDGAGTVEVAAVTREGYVHMWNTPGQAAADGEAWHWHQDDRNTGHYGTDTRPPAAVRHLAVSAGSAVDTLSFIAPGDDWNSGTAARYEVRRSSQPITQASFATATPVAVDATPRPAGSQESLSVAHVAGQSFYAVRAVDAAGNIGPVPVRSGGVLAAQAAAPSTLPNTGHDAAAAAPAVALSGLGVIALWRRRRRARAARPSQGMATRPGTAVPGRHARRGRDGAPDGGRSPC